MQSTPDVGDRDGLTAARVFAALLLLGVAFALAALVGVIAIARAVGLG